MKTKTREISVNNIKFLWTVREDFWPNHTLKIWLEARGKVPWCEATTENHATITPANVANVIGNVLTNEEIKSKLAKSNFTYKCTLQSICTNLSLST